MTLCYLAAAAIEVTIQGCNPGAAVRGCDLGPTIQDYDREAAIRELILRLLFEAAIRSAIRGCYQGSYRACYQFGAVIWGCYILGLLLGLQFWGCNFGVAIGVGYRACNSEVAMGAAILATI